MSTIPLKVRRRDPRAMLFKLATGGALAAILGMLFLILGHLAWNGAAQISMRFLLGGTQEGMFDPARAGLFPMIYGTAALVILMTVAVVPAGVATAVYLHEYARPDAWVTRLIHMAINNLAGVPSIVFGLFGLGFFVQFVGAGLDRVIGAPQTLLGKPSLLWAAATLAMMTLPVMIVATEEALRAVPQGIREASLALGATRLQTLIRAVLPQAMPGVLTGTILAVSRGAGEVAPILFTGVAYYLAHLPSDPADPFMHLGYHIFVLSTQSPDIERTKPILFGAVLVLLGLTFLLNLAAVLVRASIRSQIRHA